MRALYVILPALGLLVIAYRYYSAFIAARIMGTRRRAGHAGPRQERRPELPPDQSLRPLRTPFAAISGAGPLIGPVLAMQFGFAPGLIWLVAGVCLAGAVHDSMILWASTRRGGRSLSEIARSEIGPVAGATAADRDPLHHHHCPGRSRPGRRQRPAGKRLGHVHYRHVDPPGVVHGPVHVSLPEGAHR